MATDKCSVAKCDNEVVCRGLCNRHYLRWQRFGDPLGSVPRRNGAKCKVDSCSLPSSAKGMCWHHYYAMRRYGDCHAAKRAVRKQGEGTISNGYHFTTVIKNGVRRQVGTHRLVMEQKLGRKLRDSENVHHINGIRADNRPENLELWVKSQPCGQRPQDLLAWAREILATYGSEVTV
jgi:hypothetical protein